VQVEGASESTQRTIETAAAIELGGPMIRLDTQAAQQRVSALGEVESVRVVRVWPHTVVVEVQERMPVGVVPGPGGQTEVLGSDGRSMAVLETQPTDLPELRASSAELTVLIEALSHLAPEIVANTEWASLENGRVELRFRDDDGVVVWGPPVDNWIKADVLTVLLESQPDARWFDLSAARAPITALERPARGATPSAAASAQPNGQANDATSPTDGVPGGTLPDQPTTSVPTPLEQYGEQPAQLATPQW
jgi:cell division protein FtsQ